MVKVTVLLTGWVKEVVTLLTGREESNREGGALRIWDGS
jgi:hypothetical protein